ncbi:MAG TPA: hypothetical protein VHG88_06340 [Burkholderiales bacterium]|nr:hypothetical protein [Burkholderiales bacterium]
MSERTELEDSAPLEPQQADPYDGVALGVECAWPVLQATAQAD